MSTKEYSFHPVADLLPPMTADEFAGLCDSIKTDGLQVKIMTWNNQIIDGRHRYKACLETGAPINVEDVSNDVLESDLVGFVLALNSHRRALSPSQKAMIAAKLANVKQGQKPYKYGFTIEVSCRITGASIPYTTLARRLLKADRDDLVLAVESGARALTDAIAEIGPEKAEPDLETVIADVKAESQKDANAKKTREKLTIAEHALEKLKAELADRDAKIEELRSAKTGKQATVVEKDSPATIGAIQDATAALAEKETELKASKNEINRLRSANGDLSASVVEKTTKLNKMTSPIDYLNQLSRDADELAKRIESAPMIIRKWPAGETVPHGTRHPIDRLSRACDDMLTALKDHTAHNGDAQKTPLKLGKSDLKEIIV